MNTIASICAKKLYEILETLTEINQSNNLSEGYNCAVFCIKDGIKTRIDLISKFCDKNDANSTCAIICLDQIENLIVILDECINDANGLFKEGFEKAVTKFKADLENIIQWLNEKAQIK